MPAGLRKQPIGHSDGDMTQHYLHVQKTIRQAAIARPADAFGEQPNSDPEPPEDGASCTIISLTNVYKMNNRDSGQDSGQKKMRRVKGCAGMKKALKHKCFKASRGGDKRDRTADLLNAIQALS